MLSIIATDSGGVQKEAFYFKKPLIILREETEWQELVDAQVAFLVGDDLRALARSHQPMQKLCLPNHATFLWRCLRCQQNL
jgi:UDP-GlcNAc3NAcA epimerase